MRQDYANIDGDILRSEEERVIASRVNRARTIVFDRIQDLDSGYHCKLRRLKAQNSTIMATLKQEWSFAKGD